MKHGRFFRSAILLTSIFLCVAVPAGAYKILYAEQWYRLFHLHFYQYPTDLNENIWYLEEALKADFANPLNALGKVDNPDEWARYRDLFRMHINLKLTELYRLLASKYDKRVAYFFNKPWQTTNLKSLEMAEYYYNTALYYWDQTLYWSAFASDSSLKLNDLQAWMEENYRIETYDLDYGEYIELDLERLEQVREDFLAMDENTY